MKTTVTIWAKSPKEDVLQKHKSEEMVEFYKKEQQESLMSALGLTSVCMHEPYEVILGVTESRDFVMIEIDEITDTMMNHYIDVMRTHGHMIHVTMKTVLTLHIEEINATTNE